MIIIVKIKSIQKLKFQLISAANCLQVVVSDHGMTENGNHGGSSYEEMDSLALFIGSKNHAPNHALSNHDTIFQVMKLYFMLVGCSTRTNKC